MNPQHMTDMDSTCAAVCGCASSSLAPLKKYDVFISFRGEDTRGGFTSHLHAALCRNKIETYIDYRIQKGEEVWVELEKAIKDSTLFLVIFSENFASSTWCLNELLEIMGCKKNEKDVDVIPVFYKIEPSHVRKQTGSYKKALEKQKQSKEKMQKWKETLYETANLSGFDSQVYSTEIDLIEDIVKEVLQKLNLKDTHELRGLFLPDENFSQIESLLRIDSSDVQVIGLWGMGGIGKTTLAAAIFHKFSSQYESCCFLENVAEESKRHGFNYVCNRLLSKLSGEDLHIDTLKVISSVVMRRLKRKKTFIVLDDVNNFKLLEELVGAGRDWLGARSRVIVTSRDKHVLDKGVDKIYEVKEMNFKNSLRLFSLNAFNKSLPKQGYEELSKRAIVYAKGIPLALKVLGSFLHSKSENEWDSALNKLKKIPNVEIQNVLRMSYDELDDEEKNIFLDIACFLKGRYRGSVTKILNACGFFADIGIRNLLDKALITITSNNCIEMHDLIQEMGKEIVCKESIQNPEQRSRLWDPEEVFDVLTYDKGTSAIQALLLDMTQISSINLSPKAFKKMPNIRLLTFQAFNGHSKRINVVHLPMGLHSLPKSLRYLGWDGYPLKSLPLTFCPEKLVDLSLTNSNVEKLWQGVQDLPNLERINLSGSKHLMECPTLSQAPNLKYVIFSECESLLYVDPSMFSLPKLEFFNVTGCTSLKSLGSNTCSQSLRGLYLEGSGLNELPPSILLMIRNLDLSFSINDGIVDLPEKFANEIELCGSGENECDILITLHKAFSSFGFRSLTYLTLADCHSLCEIPDNISLLSSLQHLLLCNCAIISLPESMKYLPRLKLLEVLECKMLQCVPALPQCIQCFQVWSCQSLRTVLSSTSEPSKKAKCTFLFPNCIKLDEHSYDAILKEAIVGIELGAKPLSIVVLENEEDASSDDENDCWLESVRSGKLCYFLPTRNGKFQDWFHYHSTQTLVTIELPPNILGFIFYLVISQFQSCQIGCYGSFGCECYLETSLGERTNVTSFFVDENALLNPKSPFKFMSDHVFIWHDAECCMKIVKAINDRSTIHNPKLTFKFFGQTEDNEEVEIKECGFRWIYPSEYQIVEEEERCKSKRNRTIHELEDNASQNRANGSEEFDEQEETLPPTKKLKQCVFGTSSNLEVDETEDLRRLLEELLHIGFGRDLGL